jgi:predicted P-loop ATPase
MHDWLQDYVDRGFRLVFYETKTKGPREPGWTTKEYRPEDYRDGQNVGVMLGTEVAPGQYLVDIDFDWPEGVRLARHILPNAGFGFGRDSRKVSHAFYLSPTPLVSRKYLDIDGSVLFELRGRKTDGSIGLQTMVPPSIHPSGERLVLRATNPLTLEATLQRDADLYGIGCILFKHLGLRGFLHDIRLAVAGFLMKHNVTEDETLRVCRGLAEATGNNVDDAKLAVTSTAQQFAAGNRVTGQAVLLKELGEPGKAILSRIKEWLGEGDFVTDGKNKIIPNHQENILKALDKLDVSLSYDQFSKKAFIRYNGSTGPLEELVKNKVWFTIERKFQFRPSMDYFTNFIVDVAISQPFHPVRDYLSKLTWDGTPRIDQWLITYAQAADTDYVRKISAIVLIAAVRRVMKPGCKFDELLVLESDQGMLKSSALRALCPEDSWFSDDLPLDVDAKQIIERTTGKWIIEAAELSGMRASQMEHLKAMLSRQVDGPVRLAYERLAMEQPRQFICIGTTNSHTYLSDSTGNRRFWPVRVERFDVEGIARDRDQLWAEAVVREAQGESIRLPVDLYEHAGIQQERRRTEDPWELIISEEYQEYDARVTPKDLWRLIGMSIDRMDMRSQSRLHHIMQRLGFRRMTVVDKDSGKRVKGWGRGMSENPMKASKTLEKMKKELLGEM